MRLATPGPLVLSLSKDRRDAGVQSMLRQAQHERVLFAEPAGEAA